MVIEVWSALPDTYKNAKTFAFGVFSIFGSTYLCEQVFSSMNLIKGKLRSRLNNESLRSCLKAENYFLLSKYCPALQGILGTDLSLINFVSF